jgi:hypothetical protein
MADYTATPEGEAVSGFTSLCHVLSNSADLVGFQSTCKVIFKIRMEIDGQWVDESINLSSEILQLS